jgi:hypothetical protein
LVFLFLSALICKRFARRRLVAAVVGRDKSRRIKAVTGYRTPKELLICNEEIRNPATAFLTSLRSQRLLQFAIALLHFDVDTASFGTV